MELSKIIEAYDLTEEFIWIMEKFEKKGIMYGQLEENSIYFKNDKKREKMMKNCKDELIHGAGIYFNEHPEEMSKAQKYYSGGFGKPCPIKTQK